MNDVELVRLSLENKENFYYLIERYQQRLERYIHRLTNIGFDEAQDILQDIFIKAYRNLNGFDQNLSFSSWIYRIAHNEIINYYYRNKKRIQLTVSENNKDDIIHLSELINDDPDSHEQLIAEERGNEIRQLLAQLPKKYSEVLILYFLEELSYNEISDVLRKPPGTVATLINRGKAKFKKLANRSSLLSASV
jgi:RNA polymerase sigma-70 factor (ECF subfamily)